MKKNFKKGFTLIELLFVLFILGIIFFLVINNVLSQKNTVDSKIDSILKNNLIDAAQTYYTEYSSTSEWSSVTTFDNVKISCIDINSLINKGYFSKETNVDDIKDDYVIRLIEKDDEKKFEIVKRNRLTENVDGICTFWKKTDMDIIQPESTTTSQDVGDISVNQNVTKMNDNSNTFKVDLDLSAKVYEVIKTQAEYDVYLMLITDLSGSMRWCTSCSEYYQCDKKYNTSSNCGTGKNKKNFTEYGIGGNCNQGSSCKDGCTSCPSEPNGCKICSLSRIGELKNAASALKNSFLNQYNTEEKIHGYMGLIGFTNTAKDYIGGFSYKDSVIGDGINSLFACGATYAGKGLKMAYDLFSKVNNEFSMKYAILLSDGVDDSLDKSTAEAQAKALKDAGVTVYTIGYALESEYSSFYKGLASQKCGANGTSACYYDSNSGDISKIFNTINNIINSEVVSRTNIESATVEVELDNKNFTLIKADDFDGEINGNVLEYTIDVKDSSDANINKTFTYYIQLNDNVCDNGETCTISSNISNVTIITRYENGEIKTTPLSSDIMPSITFNVEKANVIN